MRTRTRKKKISSFLIIPFAIIVLIVSFLSIYKGMEATSSLAANTSPKLSVNKIKDKNVYSAHASLLDRKLDNIIYNKSGNERCYPASLTKIMTAIIAIENNDDIDAKTTIDNDILSALIVENASMAGYQSGEYTTLKDLLYGCILASGADASMGLVKITCNSEKEFIDMMNEKAVELGMNDTHFTNATGLHDDDHYSTTNDMALLLDYALNNRLFKEVFTSKSHNVKTDIREFTVNSTFFSEYSGGVDGMKVKGAKTGTTHSAGSCLASYVRIDGRSYVLITCNAPLGNSQQPFSFDDLNYVCGVGTV